MIRKRGKKWVLYTKDGKRVIGVHDSEESAKSQERKIQIEKARKAGHRIPRKK